MYLSAEQLAAANTAIRRTFEQSSIAWQAIPNWDIGDPSATKVRSDAVNPPNAATSLPITTATETSDLTLAQMADPTPDSVLAKVVAATTKLATSVDGAVIANLLAGAVEDITLTATGPGDIMKELIGARAKLEDKGFRAPSCLLTNTKGLQDLTAFSGGEPVLEQILAAAGVNSLHRCTALGAGTTAVMVLLGRRQRIAHGAAADASCGEEPVDLAVSVSPSLEVVGVKSATEIEAVVRIRFATRITDNTGVIRFHE